MIAIAKTYQIITAKPVFKKLSFNLISQGSLFSGKWIFNFVMAKNLPASLFGTLTLVQALGNFLTNLFAFGGTSYMIHAIGKREQEANYVLNKSIKLTTQIAICAALIWLGIQYLELSFKHLKIIGWSILLAYIMALNVLIYGFFKGLGKFHKESQAAILFLVCSILVLCSFWILGFTNSLNFYVACFCGLQTIPLIIGILFFRKWKKAIEIQYEIPQRNFMKEKIPFGLHELQGALYIHIIILILGFLVPEDQLGLYRAVQLFITPISLLPGVVSQVTLNKLSSLSSEPIEQIKTFRKFLQLISAIGIFFFGIYFLFGGSFINWVYDYKYPQHTINTLILCFSAAFLLRFISSNYGVMITSSGNQNLRVLMTFLSILVSISLTYFLTKSHGIIGAAFAGMISFGVICLGYAAYCELILFKKLKNHAGNNSRS